MTNIKIKDGPKGLKSVTYHFGGYLEVWADEGYRRYQVRAAVKSLEKLYDAMGETTFRLVMLDGLTLVATATPIVFSYLTAEQKVGPQPGDFPIIRGAKPSTAEGVKGGLVLLCIIVGLLFWIFSGDDAPSTPPQPERLTENTAQAMAITLCKPRVKDSLRSPSTADFPFFSQAVYDGSRRATLASYVDAQNGFGATVRTNFVCVVEYSGGGSPSDFGSWKIVDFVILQ